jgi:hypothetical protein
LLQSGQAERVLSQRWMQSRWNTCPQQPHAMLSPGWSGSPVVGGGGSSAQQYKDMSDSEQGAATNVLCSAVFQCWGIAVSMMQSRWNTWPQQPHAMLRPGVVRVTCKCINSTYSSWPNVGRNKRVPNGAEALVHTAVQLAAALLTATDHLLSLQIMCPAMTHTMCSQFKPGGLSSCKPISRCLAPCYSLPHLAGTAESSESHLQDAQGQMSRPVRCLPINADFIGLRQATQNPPRHNKSCCNPRHAYCATLL